MLITPQRTYTTQPNKEVEWHCLHHVRPGQARSQRNPSTKNEDSVGAEASRSAAPSGGSDFIAAADVSAKVRDPQIRLSLRRNLIDA